MAKELLRVTLNTANRGDCLGAARQRKRHRMRIESGVVGVVVALAVSGCLEPATCYELLACSDGNRDAGTQTLNLEDGGSLVTRDIDAAHSSDVTATSSDDSGVGVSRGDGGGFADVSRVSDAALPTNVTLDGGVGADFVVDAGGDATDTTSLDSGFGEDSGGSGCPEGYRTAGEECELAPRVEAGGGFHMNGAAGHTCVVTREGDIRCWGDNRVGQCGEDPEEPAVADEVGEEPSTVSLLAHAVKVDLGNTRTCALTTEGRVFCWGNTPSAGATEIALNTKAADVGTGDGFECALLEGGEVWCWGDNSYGATGQASGAGSTESPARVVGLESVSQLSVGGQHVCALQTDGDVRCWGRGGLGEVGIEIDALMDEPGELPNQVSLPQPAVKVVAGSGVTCALVDDGSVWCWGSGSISGANGTNADSILPIKIALADTALDLAVSRVGCATLANRQVHCWGTPYWDQEEAVSVGNAWQPDLGSDHPVHVSLSPVHMCITLASDRVRCWGAGGWGELGVPPEEVTGEPVTTRIVGY